MSDTAKKPSSGTRNGTLSGPRRRGLATLQAMVQLYCHGHAHARGARAAQELCPDCAATLRYASRRLERCIFGDAKPNCADCTVHCYRADMRENIRAVMRWAGPRMLLRHPIMTVTHMLAGRRPAPTLPARSLGIANEDAPHERVRQAR
jgi:hypothetical protein